MSIAHLGELDAQVQHMLDDLDRRVGGHNIQADLLPAIGGTSRTRLETVAHSGVVDYMVGLDATKVSAERFNL